MGGQQYYNPDKHYKNQDQDDSNSSMERQSRSGSKYRRKQVEIKLFVGQIPKTWEESDLKSFFEKYGEVVKVQVIRDKNNQHKGCAFVVFASILCANIAIEALKATKLPGMQNPIQVKWADNEPDRLGIRQDQDYVLYVAHIPKNATESDIRNVFENYGNVKEVDIPKDQAGYSRGYVFVKYENIEQAILSKQALHEKQVLNNQTQPLVVKFYDPKKKQTSGPTQQNQPNLGGSNSISQGQSIGNTPNKTGGSQSNNQGYNNNNLQGSNHHNSRDYNGQQGYNPQQSQTYPPSTQQSLNRSMEGYNHQREHNNNYNQNNMHANNNSSSSQSTQSSYRGGPNNYQGHHEVKSVHGQGNQVYPPRENLNLSGSGHYEQPNQTTYENYPSHSTNFRDQYGGGQQSYPQQNQQQQNYPNQNKTNGNFSYSSSYPQNQPAGSNNSNYQYNQQYNNNGQGQGSQDYNYQNQQQNDFIPPPQGQSNYPYNEFPHHNNGPNPINNNNPQTQPPQGSSGSGFPPYFPHNQNSENLDPYTIPPTHNEQPNFNNVTNNMNTVNSINQHQQLPQQDQYQQQYNQHPQQQPASLNPQQDTSPQTTSQQYPETANPVESTQPTSAKSFIKYYTDDKIPYYYDIQTQGTTYDQPPLGSIIFNPDGTQEHVQPESIEQLQKFQQETGMTENKELEILSQKTTGPPGANLFIFHLPNDYRDSDLLRLFKRFGDLLSARVITRPDGSSKGYGFVSYTHPDGATQAIAQMNGLQVGKKKLKVEVKKGQGDGDLPPSMHQSSFQPF